MIQESTYKFNTANAEHTFTFKGAEGHLASVWLKLDAAPVSTAVLKIIYINEKTSAEVEIHNQEAGTTLEQNYYVMPSALVSLSDGDKIKATFTNTTAIEGTVGIILRDRI